ncbi:MAG: nickel-dependent lactate racemase [Anaerolineales bacterium]|nr:MAG: nickel-dependent lactate racemase [Anaerolineales bacterium]
MIIKLAYGKTGLDLELSDELNVTLVEPAYVPGLPDQKAALREALQAPIQGPPLRDRVRPEDKVGVLFSDITRPTPNHLILPAVLDELAHVPRENITLFNALGTHRPNTEAELRSMLGDALVDDYRIVQNNSFDASTQVHLGVTSRSHDIWLNRELVECDVKILTGFIEPHLFAGFSGGGKAVMPGMAGQRTVLGNHDAGMVGHPQATWGVTWGNPIWEEVREVAFTVDPTFLVNVTLNKDKQITGVFAGDLDTAHEAGCAFVKETAMVPVPRPFDIVITTNSGYPLDLNLYQSVKGLSAAVQVVRQGGAIIIAADCWDGIPEHGLYGQLLREADSPQALLDTVCAPGFLKQDQWQAQIQAQVQLKADVYVRTDNLTVEQIEMALLRPSPRIEDTVAELLSRYGSQASICVLPEGPQTIPYVRA